ncbi:hypothetical protein Sta7437_2834 [Stanieria cyanosphaera PCC 7437]|uniref:Uncharacterized protein n=1 Tax=Stanieria cyanosphaera (strain ATCC 29371 / PCC 7437) TaxID=111780 RepID=K9XUS5_STAC7|nr:hypothetical protein [Stanieria cyanosphaera]AFZ36355.1 hypothetical protein Sta7437_2834 [Stanieria cyanosphaera PCC 7437]
MKMQAIKQEIYEMTCTKNTKQLKKEHPDLTKDKDLRYKIHWQQILQQLKVLREQNLELSFTDLEKSARMLKKSLFTVGKIAGLDNNKIEIDWQRIQLSAQFSDIHIEEL